MHTNDNKIVVCPKCSLEQESARECKQCGVLIEKDPKSIGKSLVPISYGKVEIRSPGWNWIKTLFYFICVAIVFLLVFLVVDQKYGPIFPKHAISPSAEATSNLRNAWTRQEMYFVENEIYADSIHKLMDPKYGFSLSKGVTIKVIYADEETCRMLAIHEKGSVGFVAMLPGGPIETIPISEASSMLESLTR